MSRLVITACLIMLCVSSAFAQFELYPQGPYTRFGITVPFGVKLTDPNVTIQNFRWVLYTNDGVTIKTIDTLEGATASTYAYKPLQVGEIPANPVPQLAVTLTLLNRFSPTPYKVTRVFPIEFMESIFALIEGDGKGGVYITPLTRTLGRREQGAFAITQFPPLSTSAALMLIGSNGDTLKKVIKTGAPYIAFQDALKLEFDINSWPGGVRVRANVAYQGSPAGGYVQDLVIPDSVPVAVVTASKGFGPFRRGVDAVNTFTAKGLGPACTAVEYAIQYKTDDGQVHTPVRDTIAYDPAKDSVVFTYNMRDVTPGSMLSVRGVFGALFPQSRRVESLTIIDAPPIHTINGALPIKPGVDKSYVVRIDSLPPRIVELQMILTNASGTVVQQVSRKAQAGSYIRTDSISFNARELSLGTYVVRTRAVNEQRDDAPDFFYGFDVRDLDKFFLIADSWGPYTQGDSATITPAVTDVRPFLPGWTTSARFMIIDSTMPGKPLYVSPEVSLESVRSRDSVVYWPDASYEYGAPITRRARIQTSGLPLSAKVILETTNISPVDERSPGYTLAHPVFMVPSPGVLTSSPRLDSTLIVTRKSPVTVRLTNITPAATGVRFRVNGTRNTSALVQTIVPVQGQKVVSFAFDAGQLPVNAVLTVAPVTSLSNDIGAEIVRTINTRPDTLSMRAEPPIDTLLMEWDIEPSTQLIRGVSRLDAKLFFTKLPAQTEEIQVLSFDDTGVVIDSIAYPVPYRLTYDSALVVSGSFPFRTFNTSSLQVRYITDGGPEGGIRYNKRVVTRYREPLALRVRKMNYSSNPPSVDNTPALQGSNDILDLAVRWRANDPKSTVGYTSPCTVDSVRFEILDCAGQIVESMLVRPEPRGARSGSAADTLFEVRHLPLSTDRVQARLYSKSMRLPASGVLVSASLNLRTNPNLYIPLGLSYPTYRVNDTTVKKLEQQMVITNLDAVVAIDSISIVDKSGKTVYMFESQRPRMDTIVLPIYDFNTLSPDKAPYTIIGVVRTASCGVTRATRLQLAQVDVPTMFQGESTYNWIYSSKGWGPFQQGRAPTSQFEVSYDPTQFITSRGAVADSFEIALFLNSYSAGPIGQEVVKGYRYPASEPIPRTARASATFNLTSLDSGSTISIRVKRWKMDVRGYTLVSPIWTHNCPIAMLPFPDQPIDPDTTRYEQSVLAGSSGLQVMPSNYNFGMQPQSSDIDFLRFTVLSSAGAVLDTFSIKPTTRDLSKQTSIFKTIRDVAQYPWPHVAPDREQVSINIGYQFKGADRPTKVQKTSIRILPRAEWLNGSTARLNGTATATSIPVSVSIPMPASVYESTVPVFGLINYFVEGEGTDKSTNLVINANYNPATRGFTMQNTAPGGSFWVPTISLAGGANYTKTSTVRDGERSGEFTARYRFEEAQLPGMDTLIPNRELRVRSLYSSSFGGAVSMIRWIQETAETMERLIKTSTLVASGGLLQITPTFTIDATVQHTSTINIGTEDRGALVHVGEEEPTSKTEQDEFPTSQSVAFTLTGGGGIEASMLGLIGIGASVTDDYMFASGSIFSGPVASAEYNYYPTRLNYSRWFNMELSLFFGIINIDLFRGRMLHLYDPRIMPSYLVFDEAWESVFTSSGTSKPREQTQVLEQISKLPEETPYYRPAPAIAANDSQLVTVHLEQSLLGRNGRLMLSTLDRASHSLTSTTVIADNRNAMHDPAVQLLGNDGSALIAWVQNDVDAYNTPTSLQYADLLRTENIHAAWYDAATQRVVPLPRPALATDELIDGVPTVAVARDLRSAIIVWNGIDPTSNTIEKYVRRIVRTDSTWKLQETIPLQATRGVNRSIGATSLNDGSYLVTWINDDLSSNESRLMSARIYPNGSVDLQQIEREDGVNLSKARMESNGSDALLVFARSLKTAQSEYDRSLDAYRFVDGSWTPAGKVSLDEKYGVVRHIDVDLAKDGTFVVVIDAIDHNEQGRARHSIYAATGAIDQPSDSWKLLRNHPAFLDARRSIWSLSTAVGPDNVYYVATQELDSLRDNRQAYTNGLQLGPSRCNAVIRAVKLNDQGQLISVPFGNAVTSVHDEPNAELESAMRYRIKVLDPAPNPVREACVVPLAVQRSCNIEVKLFDAVGSYVATLYAGQVAEGIQGVSFTVSDLTSGHYTVVVSDQLGVAGSVPIVVVR